MAGRLRQGSFPHEYRAALVGATHTTVRSLGSDGAFRRGENGGAGAGAGASGGALGSVLTTQPLHLRSVTLRPLMILRAVGSNSLMTYDSSRSEVRGKSELPPQTIRFEYTSFRICSSHLRIEL